ncbi:MAG: hypothetical protein ACOX9C_04350 [Kiritimatiellia bacterium]|jgi:hypothetical protein
MVAEGRAIRRAAGLMAGIEGAKARLDALGLEAAAIRRELQTAREAAGRETLLCNVVEADPKDYAKIIMNVNMCRRRVSSGGRVLRYLELYRNEVLAAAEEFESGRSGGRGRKTSSHGTSFTVEAIRERLRCRKQDVSAGILLLKCRREQAVPYKDAKGRWQLRPASDEELDALGAMEARVRAGRTPIARWTAGLGGKVATEDKPRGATDHAGLAMRALTSLRTVFENWRAVPMEQRGTILDFMHEVLYDAPDDVREVLERLCPQGGGGRK